MNEYSFVSTLQGLAMMHGTQSLPNPYLYGTEYVRLPDLSMFGMVQGMAKRSYIAHT